MSEKRVLYKVEQDHWAEGPKYEVFECRVVSGPNENGAYNVETRAGRRDIHPDHLGSTPLEAIEIRKRQLRQKFERETAALDALEERIRERKK